MKRLLIGLFLSVFNVYLFASPQVVDNIIIAGETATAEDKLIFLYFYKENASLDSFMELLASDEELENLIEQNYIVGSLRLNSEINKTLYSELNVRDRDEELVVIVDQQGGFITKIELRHLGQAFILIDKIKSALLVPRSYKLIDFDAIRLEYTSDIQISTSPSNAVVTVYDNAGAAVSEGRSPLITSLSPGNYILNIKHSNSSVGELRTDLVVELESRKLDYTLPGQYCYVKFGKDKTYAEDFKITYNGETRDASYDVYYLMGLDDERLKINGKTVDYNFMNRHYYEITPEFKIPINRIDADGLVPVPEPPVQQQKQKNVKNNSSPVPYMIGGLIGFALLAYNFDSADGQTGPLTSVGGLIGMLAGGGLWALIESTSNAGIDKLNEEIASAYRKELDLWEADVLRIQDENNKLITEAYQEINKHRNKLNVFDLTNSNKLEVNMN